MYDSCAIEFGVCSKITSRLPYMKEKCVGGSQSAPIMCFMNPSESVVSPKRIARYFGEC